MGIVGWRETTGRSLTHQFGESPSAERRFVVTLDSTDTGTQSIINAVGISHLAPHPEYGFLKMTNATVTEASPTPFHAEVSYSYSVPEQEEQDPNPLARPDVWSFSTSGAAIPAFYYFDGDTPKVLVNSADDFFEGAMADESEVRATIQSNRPSFPLALAAQVTNCVNSDAYLGAPQYHWKCGGISASQATEVVNDVEVRYWQITAELVYRQTGWELQLPDVGYNVFEGGQKIRGYVLDPDDKTTRIPCANPIALNTDGTRRDGAPTILKRRVHRAVAFAGLFGQPPS
jgi:hypothetical protein